MENTLNICIKENLISNSDHESDYESKISYIRSNEKIKTIRYPTPPNRKEIKLNDESSTIGPSPLNINQPVIIPIQLTSSKTLQRQGQILKINPNLSMPLSLNLYMSDAIIKNEDIKFSKSQ